MVETPHAFVSVIIAVAAVSCLLSFWWARRRYFKIEPTTPKHRGGLGPLGLAFAILSIAQIVIEFGLIPTAPGLVAVLLLVLSLLLFWASIGAFGADKPHIAFTGIEPMRLVTTGPYRLVRHPIYSAYILYWIASLVATPSVFSAIAVSVMTYLYVKAARAEEGAIERGTLGGEYSSYKGRTGMFVPFIGVRR